MSGHAGKFAAQFTSVTLKSKIEETSQWVEYTKLSATKRAQSCDLISQALVQAYVEMDKDLLLMEESGLMVSNCA